MTPVSSSRSRPSPSSSTRRRVLAQIALRLTVALALLAGAGVMAWRTPDAFPVDVVVSVLGAVFAMSLVFLATLPWVEARPWLADLQGAADVLVITTLVGVTGGVTSLFTPLYFLPILAASAVRFRRGALEIAALSSVVYAGLVLLHYMEAAGTVVLPVVVRPSTLPVGEVAVYTVGLNVLSFAAVGLLAGALAERWRRADVQLVRASAAIADLQAFNSFLVEHLVSGVATADAAGRLLTLNRAAAAITGAAPGGAVGRPAADVLQVPPDVHAAIDGVRRVELRFARHDGRTLDVGMSITRLPLPDGSLGYLYTFQDVTEVKRLEREAQARDRLAAVGEMAAGVAHEIRNPLASMSGSLQILRQELELTGDRAQLMDIVLKESERLNQTIRSFLAYARPEPLVTAPVDLGTVVSEAAALLRHSPDRDERHAVVVSLPEAPVIVDADEAQVKQVVWNLATNGLRAMPSGGTLVLGARTEPSPGGPGRTFLSVSDEGVGIPASDIEAIFQPFAGTFAKGSGLGLAIVQRIAAEHGAAIEVESTPGAGTTVRIVFPRAGREAGVEPSVSRQTP